MKMLKFEQKMRGSTNVYVLLQKWESIKMLEFVWKLRNWSEYWNLRTKLGIDQNDVSCIVSEKFGINQKVDVWLQ